jgi:hypothetical protein
MYDYAHIEAFRWHLDAVRILEKVNKQSPDVKADFSSPEEYFHTAILREANRTYKISRHAIDRTLEEIQRDEEIRNETAGRVVDVGMPTEISNAVVELASVLDTIQREFQRQDDRIQSLRSKASFSTETVYDRLSRKALNIHESMTEYTVLYVRSQLWRMWVREALNQLKRIQRTIKNPNSNYDETLFPYLSHPQIMVSTVTCTALIEEVGGHYINQHEMESIDMDNTSPTKVLRKIEENYTEVEVIDLSLIRDEVTNTRTDMVHYIRKRGEAMDINNLDDYINACFECIRLVNRLVCELVYTSIEDYEKEVLSEAID